MSELQLVEIIPGLSLVSGPGGGRFPLAYSFLVDGDASALIDTGCGIETLQALRRSHRVDRVIASHAHPDHTAGCWLFEGVPLYAPEATADTFGRFDLLGERFTEPGHLAARWRHFVSTEMGYRSAPPTQVYADGESFEFGRLTLVAIHTPGHTTDHTCLFEPRHGVLLSFDIDLTSFGPWYGHRESDVEDFKASIRHLMALRPRLIVSSHKGIINDGIDDHLQRYLDVFDARDRALLDLLARERTLDELLQLSPLYGGHPYAAELLRYWERQMIHKHLDGLIAQGRVQSAGEGFVAT